MNDCLDDKNSFNIDQNVEIFLCMLGICLNFGIFLYWDNRNHINYFRSIKNNQYY